MLNERQIISLLKSNPLLKKIYIISREIDSDIYIVGGSIRDLFVKGTFADLDFALKCKVSDIANAVSRSLKGTSFSLGTDLKSCWRVAIRYEGELLEMDFTAFKGENIEADLAMRDFTINAVAVSLPDLFESSSPSIIDPLRGIAHIKQRILSPISEEAIIDDPLRIIRGFRLKALFDLDPEDDFIVFARRHGFALNGVAPERIRTELFKTFSSQRASSSLEMMAETGILKVVLPEVTAWEDLDQGSFHKFDLLRHSLKTFQYLEEIFQDKTLFTSSQREMIEDHLDKKIVQGIDRRGLLKFAALLHDSGKPATFKREDGKVSFYGHDEEGALINKRIATRLKMGTRAGKILSNITKRHMRSLHLSKVERLTCRAMDRMIRDSGDELIEILLLALADTLATRDARELEFTDVEGLITKILNRYDELGQSLEEPFLNGAEVMRIAGIGEGARVGRYLRIIADARIDGEIENRAEAIDFLKRLKDSEN